MHESRVLKQTATISSFFGYYGVIFPPFFIGFFLYGLNVFLLRLPKTPILLSFYIWIILHYKTLAESSLSSFNIAIVLFIVLSIMILILSAQRGFKLGYFSFQPIKAKKS
jgi:hypothetical protein